MNHELIDRYVYDVVRRLPQEQRADIEKELRGLIDDMLQDKAQDGAPSKEDIEAVLKELGRPSELAAKYRGGKQYLIGPQYYDIYLLVLKIVLAATGFGLAVAQIVSFIAQPPQFVFSIFGMFIGAIFSGLMQAFAWVTLIFALNERFSGKTPWKRDDWKPADLPSIPAKKAIIKKSEPIVGIVFHVIALIIFNAIPWVFSAYIFSGGQTTIIPVFDLNRLAVLLPLIDTLICLEMLRELLKLITGRYTVPLAAGITAINIVTLVLFLYIFGRAGIWNTNFLSALNFDWTATAQAAKLWNAIPVILSVLAAIGKVSDSFTAFSRALRSKEA